MSKLSIKNQYIPLTQQKKNTSFSKKIWQWTKKIFFWSSLLFCTLAFLFASLEAFQYYKKFSHQLENRKIENFALLEEIQKINTHLFESCQNQNKIQGYLLLAENNCQNFLGENPKETKRIPEFSESFLSFFHLFFRESNNFPEIVDEMIQEQDETTLLSTKPLDANIKKEEHIPESNKHNKKNNTLSASEEEIQAFTALQNNEQIHEYLSELGYILLETPEQKNTLILFAKDDKETPLAEISPNTFLLTIEKKTFKSKNFIEKRKHLEKKYFSQNAQKTLDALNNIDITEKNRQNASSENILVVGHNEENTDTIILLAIDHKKKNITMISIPRDLWISGRKINSFRLTFGHDIFIQQIEEITGQKISASLVLDMDVFPQLIDQVGGIDFLFKNPLIDPSYKTIDNGKKGTLFYGKGRHHLSGIEALRVARSRHTTNDFSRAKRQQEIIASLREKISTKGFSDLIPLAKILFQHLETDITPLTATKLFWKSREYTLRKGSVLSTQNILVSQMIPVGQGIKAYALLPKEDDWESIKKFIWREIHQ